MVIVDSTVWIDYLNGTNTAETEWFDNRLAVERFGLLDLMVCEVLQGLSADQQAARVLGHLKRFEIFNSGGVETFPVFVYTAAARGVPAEANVIASAVFILALALVVVSQTTAAARRKRLARQG